MKRTTEAKMTFHGSPAKKTTNRPEAIIRVAVPRSGCLRISMTGTMTNISAIR